ncbi:XRE family transcriptional regulator [Neisseria weixii]|uniref:XRE family transcriptional regulator n=1 Tax=Neisseria weixii TaxID=1853276 RepID=UPI00360E8B81
MNKDYMKEEWFAVLKAETGKSSQAAVAEKLGYSGTSINLVLNGKYNGNPARIAQKVKGVYFKVGCPHLETTITLNDCRDYAHAAAPTHNPAKMAHWRACLNCSKRPGNK